MDKERSDAAGEEWEIAFRFNQQDSEYHAMLKVRLMLSVVLCGPSGLKT